MLRINLLPATMRPKLVLNLDVVFVVVLVLSLAAMGITQMGLQKKLKAAQTELASLDRQAEEQKKLIAQLQAQENTRDLSATQALVAKRKKWNNFIKELTYIMPTDVWVTKMTIDATADGVGIAFSGFAPSQKSVNRFLGRMERAPSFQTVKLNSSKADTAFVPTLYAFDFSVADVFVTGSRTIASEGEKR